MECPDARALYARLTEGLASDTAEQRLTLRQRLEGSVPYFVETRLTAIAL
jgi:hypothetical protein